VTLTLDPETHVYKLEGKPIISVTQVLSAEGFARSDYGDEWYAERGTAVHEAIALHLKHELDEESVAPEIKPFVDQAVEVIGAMEIKPHLIEHSMFDPTYRYAGTLDLYGYSEALSAEVLIDWKTGSAEPAHRLQLLGGYAPLLALESYPVKFAACIYLGTGNAKARWHRTDDDEALDALHTFRSALRCHNWKKRYLNKGEDNE